MADHESFSRSEAKNFGLVTSDTGLLTVTTSSLFEDSSSSDLRYCCSPDLAQHARSCDEIFFWRERQVITDPVCTVLGHR